MNAEIQKNMAILMGEAGPQQAPQLSAEAKKKLSQAYFDLYFGLAGANWGRGDKTLGAAWYEALGQIKSMIAAKDKSNPAAMYLNQIHAAHNAKQAQIMMTNPNKDARLEITPDARAGWSRECAKKVGDAMSVINAAISKYQQKAPVQKTAAQKAAQPTPSQLQQKILIFMAAQQKMKVA